MRSALPPRSPTRAFSWCRERRRGDCKASTSLPSASPEPVLGERAELLVARRSRPQHAPPGERDDALGPGAAVEQDGLAGGRERRVERPRNVLLQRAQRALVGTVAVDEHDVTGLERRQELVARQRALAPYRRGHVRAAGRRLGREVEARRRAAVLGTLVGQQASRRAAGAA